MTFSDLQKKHAEMVDAVLSNRLNDAFQIITKLLAQSGSTDMYNRNQSLMDTYHSMLKYFFRLAPDPEREGIYLKLRQSILGLADDLQDFWIENLNLFDRKAVREKMIQFENFYAGDVKQITLMLSGTDIDVTENRLLQESLSGQLFHFLGLKNKYNEHDTSLFNAIIEYADIDIDQKLLLVSAVTLSFLRHFDSEKFNLIFPLCQSDSAEIRQRAMVGIFLMLIYHQERLPLYPRLMDRVISINDDPLFQDRMLAVFIQFIRASETEKITRKIQEEIVPEVIKLRSELEDKLKLDDLLSKESFDSKNPEWQNVFKDVPDVYQKLEQFSKMQIEGSDVFMGAFSLLKHFPFFKELPNWFLPFRKENSAVRLTFDHFGNEIDVPSFTEGLEKSTVLCNSDKYSFVLNVQNMPLQQSKMMIELFNMELKAMNEMMDDEMKLDAEIRNKIFNTQYLQDLYRFFKLHPNRKEFKNIFDLDINVLRSEILNTIFNKDENIRNLAEFYFARDRYDEAVELFEWLIGKKKTFEILEKAVYCYQKRGDFHKALELYHQAELFDKNKLWLQKKLGYCYRKTGSYEKSIEYYNLIAKSEPKELSNIAYLGQLHMDIGDYEEALKYYYKVEYANPENPKVFRPIGWCSFVTGKHDIALKYFEKVLMDKGTQNDYLLYGHANWSSGNIEKALEAYRQAVRQSGDEKWFRDTFTRDKQILKLKGFSDLDINLMIDYVLIKE